MDFQIPFTIHTNSGLISLEKPIVMAIINITPDSFYTSCKSMTQHEVLLTAEKAIGDGASILDIGGYSTRPGAPDVSMDEEIQRISNALKWIRKEFPHQERACRCRDVGRAQRDRAAPHGRRLS